MLWKVCDSFVGIDEFYEFGVEVGIAKGTVGYERVIEVLRILWVLLKRAELSQFGLQTRMSTERKRK